MTRARTAMLGAPASMVVGAAAACVVLLAGCEPVRELVLAPVLPTPCVSRPVSELRIVGLGDFPPGAGQSASVSSSSPGSSSGSARTTLDLPRGTRVVTIEGTAQGGLAALGRTAPLELPAAWDAGGAQHRVPIAYGAPDTFCTTANLAYARRDHRATLLADGSVLLTGGADMTGNAVTAIERYLPTGDDSHPLAAFVPVGIGGEAATLSPRAVLGHQATLLADGRVLVSGGAPTNSEGAFEGTLLLAADGTAAGPPEVLAGGPRAYHAGTLLPDGRVLLTGGCAIARDGGCVSGQTLASAVLYDAAAGSWADAPALRTARAGHVALLRDDGLVVLVGGLGEGGVAPAPEFYDPDEARGSTIAGPAGSAVSLPSGLVVAINDAAGPSARAVAWGARDEAPEVLPQLPSERSGATLTALEDGAVLVAGGGAGGTLAPQSVLLGVDGPAVELGGFAGSGHTATLLRDGSVLIAGGIDASGAASARAAIFLHSLVGPFESPPILTFDGARSLLPNRPGVAAMTDGALSIDAGASAPRAPDAFALLCGPTWAGPANAGFDLSALVGRDGDAEAAILFGDAARARYVAVAFAVGAAPRVLSVQRDRPGLLAVDELAGCSGSALSGDDLPDPGLAPITLRARGGRIKLLSAGRELLACDADARVPLRGSIALGAMRGRVRWDNVQVDR
jgi:hypothetical protein